MSLPEFDAVLAERIPAPFRSVIAANPLTG
jgi:hypothetical protein